MDWRSELLDDKSLVIFAVTLIGVLAMFQLSEAESVVNQITSGLFGVAVGKGLGSKK